MRPLLPGAALALLLGGGALAGPQYVDETGFAASGYDVVAYRDLETGDPAVPGSTAHVAEWNGARWAFASAENRARFLADPAAYAPAYDGHCAYGVAKGGKVPANPNLWRIVDGTLYLNINPAVAMIWERDLTDQIARSEGNWPELEDDPASERRWTSINSNRGTFSAAAPLDP